MREWNGGMRSTLITLADMLASKTWPFSLFLALVLLAVMMQMVLAGAGKFALIFVGCMGLMLILLFRLLIRFWTGAASQMTDRDA